MTKPLPSDEVLPSAFALRDFVVHNQSRITGSGPVEVMTSPQQWSYAAGFRLHPEVFTRGDGLLCVRVELEVKRGRIGVGCVNADMSTYTVTETDCKVEDGRSTVELLLKAPATIAWLMVRNTAEGDTASQVILHSIRTFQTGVTRVPDLWDVPSPEIPDAGFVQGTRTRRFQLLLTHTSRSWDWTRSTREYLQRRHANPHRLQNLPPFESLGPCPHHLYSGGMSVMEMLVDEGGARVVARRSIDSTFKIQHVCSVGERLVFCFEDFLAVIPSIDAPVGEVDLTPGSPWRIEDNWFGGLHTVFPVNDHVCLVSSSGADAALWVDLVTRKVIRRWRLPEEIYGRNYDLTPEMSVADHYIHNDIQLGHLNCAFPDGAGGCYVSSLFSGDIGHVNEHGRYSVLAGGEVGCHGVRAARNGRVYFTDSCGGRLMLVEDDGTREKWAVDSRWLHDVEQLEEDLYLFCLGDKNEIAVVDVRRGKELGRFAMGCRGVNVQFVTATPLP